MPASTQEEPSEAQPVARLLQRFPGREQQIKTLSTLIDVSYKRSAKEAGPTGVPGHIFVFSLSFFRSS